MRRFVPHRMLQSITGTRCFNAIRHLRIVPTAVSARVLWIVPAVGCCWLAVRPRPIPTRSATALG